MIYIWTFLMILYTYFLGKSIFPKIHLNSYIKGFIAINSFAIFPIILQYFKIINFITLTWIIAILFLIGFIWITYFLFKNKINFKKIVFNKHIIFASLIWIIIYLINTNFSVLSGNGFDDYWYVGGQNQLINGLNYQELGSYQKVPFLEGWHIFNAVVSKLLKTEPEIINRFSMAIINILFIISIFDTTLVVFTKNKHKFWFAYIPLILIIFPIISYEFWFGSISRLIYRPFYGSSLSVLTIPLIYIWLIEQILDKKIKWYILIFVTFAVLVMVHPLNILPIIFVCFSYLALKTKFRWIILASPFLIWGGYNLFFAKIPVKSESIYEYWNIMYDFTRWGFVCIYLTSLFIFITSKTKTTIDWMIIVLIPLFTLFMFITNFRNLMFLLFYGFGVQRLLSQLFALICIYFFVKVGTIQNFSIKRVVFIIITLIFVFNFNKTILYAGINQQIVAFTKNNSDLKFTNIKRSTKFVEDIVKKIPKNKVILTQDWININYNAKVDESSYYNYVATNMCSFNIFSNLAANYNQGLVYNMYYEIDDVLKAKTLINQIQPDYILVSQKYKIQNGFICNEKMDLLLNKFAQKFVYEQSPDIKNYNKEPTESKLFNYLLEKKYKYEILPLTNYKSKFGKIYLFKLKE